MSVLVDRVKPISQETLAEIDLLLIETRRNILAGEVKRFRASIEERLIELKGERDRLFDILSKQDKPDSQALANFNAFNGAVEEAERCLADCPKVKD